MLSVELMLVQIFSTTVLARVNLTIFFLPFCAKKKKEKRKRNIANDCLPIIVYANFLTNEK